MTEHHPTVAAMSHAETETSAHVKKQQKAPTVTPSLDPGFLTNPPKEHSRERKRKGMCATGDRHGDIQYNRREGL